MFRDIASNMSASPDLRLTSGWHRHCPAGVVSISVHEGPVEAAHCSGDTVSSKAGFVGTRGARYSELF